MDRFLLQKAPFDVVNQSAVQRLFVGEGIQYCLTSGMDPYGNKPDSSLRVIFPA